MNRKSTLAVLAVSALTASWVSVNAAGAGSYEAGDGASASGQNSVAVGHQAKAVKEGAIAMGAEAEAGEDTGKGGINSIAIGHQAKAVKDSAVSLGALSQANKESSIAIGRGAKANIYSGIAIGEGAGIDANDKPNSLSQIGSIFIGKLAGQNTMGNINAFIGAKAGSDTKGDNNIAFGNDAGRSVEGDHNISIGFNSSRSVSGNNNVALGQNAGTNIKGINNVSIGSMANNFSKTTNVTGVVAIGNNTETTAGYSVALGINAKATATGAIALGMGSQAIGEVAVASGYATVANTQATAQGSFSKARGVQSVSVGYASKAVGNYAVAQGAYAEGNGIFGTAVGYGAEANGVRSSAIGVEAVSNGERSIALGNRAKAETDQSVALGYNALSDRNADVIGYDPSETAVVKGADDALQLGAELQVQFDAKDAEHKALKKEAEAIQTERNTLLEKQKELTAENNTAELETVNAQLAENKTKLDAKIKEVSDKEMEINKLVGTWKARKGAVSVGNSARGETRQIINVAAGTKDTDAVNVAQLKAVSNGGFTVSTNSYDAMDETTKTSTKTTLIKTKIGGILPIEGKASTVYGSDTAPVANYSSDNLITYADAGTVRIGMLKSPTFTSVSIGDANPITLANDNGKLTAGGSEVVTKNNITSIFNELYSFSDGLTTESKDGKTIVKLDKEALKNDAAFKGPKGDPGEKGADGKSALDVWKSIAGNENKTAEDFAKAIKGDSGTNGTNGTNGKSAYDLWKEQPGNEGKSEKDFVNYMKGASLPDFISIVDPKGNTTPGGSNSGTGTTPDGTNPGTGSNPGGTNSGAGSNPSAGSHGGANTHANATITISNGTDASNPAPTIAFKTDDKGNGTGTITGIKTADGKDKTAAANVDYVTKVMETSAKSMDKALHALSNTIGDVRDESRSGNAMNAALSALKPLDYKEHERTQVMAGVGHYEDKIGFALGVAHFTNERTMFNAGVALSGDKYMYNAGATFRFGSSNDEVQKAPKSELEMLRAELEREKVRNAEQEAAIEMLKQLVLDRK